MKSLAMISTLLFAVLASAANGCDEQCLREKAEASKNTTFPSYLTWEYCEDTRMNFMTTAMSSLQKYSSDNFDTRYTGGMRNIKNYLLTRKSWLQECDTYMSATGKDRIFYDRKTTRDIFAKIDAVAKELDDLIAGVTYSGDMGENTTDIANEKFNNLFKAVDDHKNLMLLKGRYVIR